MKLIHAAFAVTWDLSWLVFTVLIGCGPAPKPPVVDPSQQVSMCITDPAFLVEAYQCHKTTVEGYTCVECMGTFSCVSPSSFDFCVSEADGCADRRCK